MLRARKHRHEKRSRKTKLIKNDTKEKNKATIKLREGYSQLSHDVVDTWPRLFPSTVIIINRLGWHSCTLPKCWVRKSKVCFGTTHFVVP